MLQSKLATFQNAQLSNDQMGKVKGGDGQESSQTQQQIMTIQAQTQAE